jgi:hypothetical protein
MVISVADRANIVGVDRGDQPGQIGATDHQSVGGKAVCA